MKKMSVFHNFHAQALTGTNERRFRPYIFVPGSKANITLDAIQFPKNPRRRIESKKSYFLVMISLYARVENWKCNIIQLVVSP